MTPHDLLNAVIAAPDDDAPRLAYADVLADGERAEFIRVQCRLERASQDDPWPEWVGRERDLLARRKH